MASRSKLVLLNALIALSIMCTKVQSEEVVFKDAIDENAPRVFAMSGPSGQVKVKAYKKKNGTTVKAHTRAKKSKVKKK